MSSISIATIMIIINVTIMLQEFVLALFRYKHIRKLVVDIHKQTTKITEVRIIV